MVKERCWKIVEGKDFMQAVKVSVDAKHWLSALQEIMNVKEPDYQTTIFLRLDLTKETVTIIDEASDSLYRATIPIERRDRESPADSSFYCRVFTHKLKNMIDLFHTVRGKITLGFRSTTLSFTHGKKHVLIPNHIVHAPDCEKDYTISFYKRHYDPDRIVRFTIPALSPILDTLKAYPDTTVKVHVNDGRVRIHHVEYPTDSRRTGVYLWPYEALYQRLSQLPGEAVIDVVFTENRHVYLAVHLSSQMQGKSVSPGMGREILLKPLPATTLYISKGDAGIKPGQRDHLLWSNASLLPIKEKNENRPSYPLYSEDSLSGDPEENLHDLRIDEMSGSDEPWKQTFDKSDPIEEQTSANEKESTLALLDKLPGLSPVKKQIREIAEFAIFEKERMSILGVPMQLPTLHMCFLGNPGTGKTMVARMLGKIFKELNVLTKGHVVEVDRQVLVGAYMGHTEANLLKYVKRAMGGILFIDEAYALYKKDSGKDFGLTAINGLVKLMEDYRDQMIVIFAGYKREMFEFLSYNPGLRERIPFHLEFPDYTNEELIQIAEFLAENDHYVMSDDAKEALLKQVLRHKLDETFGNARTVRNCMEKAKIRHAVRAKELGKSKDTWTTLTAEDFEEEGDAKGETLESVLAELDQLVGLDEVKHWVKQVIDVLAMEKKRLEHGLADEPLTFHMAFTGNPGTGKTTVARLLGKILRVMNILPRGHFVEATRKDLVAGYMGQTALKTAEKVKEALGGILFIDEAYALARNREDFGAEALATLIKEMEEKKGLFTVILAGYTDEMEELLQVNPGLRSRIRFTLQFPDFSASELVEIVKRKAHLSDYRLTNEAEEKLWEYFIHKCSEADESFGNGRLAEQVFERAKMNLSTRIGKMHEVDKESLIMITEEDVTFEEE
jgi:SpoVK/Ycf46/Vps4 family AAA+-type ATPase